MRRTLLVTLLGLILLLTLGATVASAAAPRCITVHPGGDPVIDTELCIAHLLPGPHLIIVRPDGSTVRPPNGPLP